MLKCIGLAGLLGAIVSLIVMILKAFKGQPKKKFVIASAVCFVVFVICFVVATSSDPAVSTSTVSQMPTLTATPVPAAAENIMPTVSPADVPAATSTPVPVATSTPISVLAATSTPALVPTSIPTEATTAEPSPTIPPVSDEQLDEGYLDAWFDDSLMIGDSIAGGLNMYATKERGNNRPCLGNMRIVGVSGLTLKQVLAGERKEKPAKVLFRSRFMTVSEVVELTQAKRLFFMLGVRDLEWYSAEKLIDVYGEIISIVKADHPDLRIYVHSLMPTLKSFAKKVHLDYATHKAANEKLRAFCEENGYTYIELADLVRDEDGFLKYEYSGPDYSFHPNDIAKAIWVKLLRSCARDEYYAGIWKPEDNAND